MNVLNPVRRVRESFIDFALPHMDLPKQQFFAAIVAHLERLQLAPGVLDAYPHELSGGMRQRIAIALATVCRPDFIIADEPTTALDVVVQKSVLELIREAQREIGSSMIFVTHDMAVHANISDRLGIMYAGRLVEEAPTAEIFSEPEAPLHAAPHRQPAADRRPSRPSRRSPARRPAWRSRRAAAGSIRAARSPWISAARRIPSWSASAHAIASPAMRSIPRLPAESGVSAASRKQRTGLVQ